MIYVKRTNYPFDTNNRAIGTFYMIINTYLYCEGNTPNISRKRLVKF